MLVRTTSVDPEQPMIASQDETTKHEYEVTKIMAHKKSSDQYLFQVYWKGFSPEDDMREPIMHLRNSPIVVREYLAKYPLV